MTYQNKLIKFIRLKNKLVFKKTGLYYIDSRDVADVKSWNEYECETIYKELKDYICGFVGASDMGVSTCIWCLRAILLEVLCFDCSYAKNHRICYDKNSLISEIEATHKLDNLNKTYKNFIYMIEKQCDSTLI